MIQTDSTLTWNIHVDWVCSRLLYFLCKLHLNGVEPKNIFLFYQAVLESVIRYGITGWHFPVSLKSLLTLVQTVMKILGQKDHYNIHSIFDKSVLEQVKRILCDPSHILYSRCALLTSGRQYRVQRCKLNQFKNPFVPVSVRILNSSQK